MRGKEKTNSKTDRSTEGRINEHANNERSVRALTSESSAYLHVAMENLTGGWVGGLVSDDSDIAPGARTVTCGSYCSLVSSIIYPDIP